MGVSQLSPRTLTSHWSCSKPFISLWIQLITFRRNSVVFYALLIVLSRNWNFCVSIGSGNCKTFILKTAQFDAFQNKNRTQQRSFSVGVV